MHETIRVSAHLGDAGRGPERFAEGPLQSAGVRGARRAGGLPPPAQVRGIGHGEEAEAVRLLAGGRRRRQLRRKRRREKRQSISDAWRTWGRAGGGSAWARVARLRPVEHRFGAIPLLSQLPVPRAPRHDVYRVPRIPVHRPAVVAALDLLGGGGVDGAGALVEAEAQRRQKRQEALVQVLEKEADPLA